MANEIPQIKDEQPVISPVRVASLDDSHEAFARTLGALSSSAAEETKELVSEQSNSMYINSVANAEQVKNSAQKMMLEHPDQAPKIAKDTDTTLDSIRNSAYVNSADRQKLDTFLKTTSQSIGLESVRTEMHQKQLEGAYTHFANFPDEVKAYRAALINDPDRAASLHDGIVTNIHNLVSTGAITPFQAGASLKILGKAHDNAQGYHDLVKDVNGTALDYHTLAASPLNSGADMTHAPINEDTRWLIDHHNSDLSFKGVQADIANRVIPNGEAWTKLTPTQQAQATEEVHGVQVADGMINSGMAFPDIEHTYKSLSEKGEILSYKDTATKNALGLYINDLKNGNYLKVMGRTPVGDSIMKNYISRNSAIQNAAIGAEEKNKLILQNKNEMVNRAIAYGQAHHIPAEYIQPIPQADVTAVQNSFKVGQDPATAYNIMKSYTPQNQLYLAGAMKEPRQRAVLSVVALGAGHNTDQENIDYIAANQNRKYTELDTTSDDKIPDDNLRNQISANITDAIKLNNIQNPPDIATALNENLIGSGVRYAKYISEKNGQYSMKTDSTFGSIDNVGSVNRYINKAYGIMTGDNYIVSTSQVKLTKPQMDYVANYAVSQGTAYLRAHMSESQHIAFSERSPLTVTVTPKNNLVAKDQYGNIAFSQPLTSELISHAIAEEKKAIKLRNEREVKVMHPLMQKINV